MGRQPPGTCQPLPPRGRTAPCDPVSGDLSPAEHRTVSTHAPLQKPRPLCLLKPRPGGRGPGGWGLGSPSRGWGPAAAQQSHCVVTAVTSGASASLTGPLLPPPGVLFAPTFSVRAPWLRACGPPGTRPAQDSRDASPSATAPGPSRRKESRREPGLLLLWPPAGPAPSLHRDRPGQVTQCARFR